VGFGPLLVHFGSSQARGLKHNLGKQASASTETGWCVSLPPLHHPRHAAPAAYILPVQRPEHTPMEAPTPDAAECGHPSRISLVALCPSLVARAAPIVRSDLAIRPCLPITCLLGHRRVPVQRNVPSLRPPSGPPGDSRGAQGALLFRSLRCDRSWGGLNFFAVPLALLEQDALGLLCGNNCSRNSGSLSVRRVVRMAWPWGTACTSSSPTPGRRCCPGQFRPTPAGQVLQARLDAGLSGGYLLWFGSGNRGSPVGRPHCKRHSSICARRQAAVRLRRSSFKTISKSFVRAAFEFRGSTANMFPVVPCGRLSLQPCHRPRSYAPSFVPATSVIS
jgi:hypothetical protein